MSKPALKHEPIHLQLVDTLAELISKEVISKLCDAIVQDLRTLRGEALEHGDDAVIRHFNYAFSKLPYVTSSGWSRRDATDWYQGWYIGIGLNHREPSLGFLTEPVVQELRRRFSEAHKNYHQSSSSLGGMLGGEMSQRFFDTPDGVFEICHTHSYYIKIKL